MPPKIPTRKDWTKLRNDAKVPAGAVKKVSIGDSIDAVFKTASMTTLAKHEQATNALLRDIDTYLADIATKYPKFVPVMRKNVRGFVKGHVDVLAQVKRGQATYYKRYKDAKDAHHAVVKGTGSVKALSTAMESLLGPLSVFGEIDAKWGSARTAVNKMMSQLQGKDTLTPDELRNVQRALESLDPARM